MKLWASDTWWELPAPPLTHTHLSCSDRSHRTNVLVHTKSGAMQVEPPVQPMLNDPLPLAGLSYQYSVNVKYEYCQYQSKMLRGCASVYFTVEDSHFQAVTGLTAQLRIHMHCVHRQPW